MDAVSTITALPAATDDLDRAEHDLATDGYRAEGLGLVYGASPA